MTKKSTNNDEVNSDMKNHWQLEGCASEVREVSGKPTEGAIEILEALSHRAQDCQRGMENDCV